MDIAISGADGYLAVQLIRRIMRTSDDRILALVRAKDRHEFQRKSNYLRALVGGQTERLAVWPITLPDASGLAQIPHQSVRTIFHCAALTTFGVARHDARAVNISGTKTILEWARTCPRLDRVVLASTIYSTGLRSGQIEEAWSDPRAGFANHYEWSKWAAETLAERCFDDLPWQIHRLSTVLCDDASGHVSQFNVVHKLWRLLHAGLLPLVPGYESTPVYLVTGDRASAGMLTLAKCAPTHAYYHLTQGGDGAPQLGALLECVYQTLQGVPEFVRRQVRRPHFADPENFNILVDNAIAFSRQTLGHTLALMRPFAQQLFVRKQVEVHSTERYLGAYRPDWNQLVSSTCARLVADEWGLSNHGSASIQPAY